MILDERNRYPWAEEEDAFLLRAKRAHIRHKVIARQIKRTPRAVDQRIANLKEWGRL